MLNSSTLLVERFLISYGGIMINLLSGFAGILLAEKVWNNRVLALFLNLFGMVSILGAVTYSALGFYYGEGDPVSWLGNGLIADLTREH